MSSSSVCAHCQHNFILTGQFSLRILPAKPIPKKACKLKGQGKSSILALKDNKWGTSKFEKFLIKRTRPRNTMVLTCGNCLRENTIPMRKHIADKKETKTNSAVISSNQLNSPATLPMRKKTKRKSRDFNAGLAFTVTSNADHHNQEPFPCSSSSYSSPCLSKKARINIQRREETKNAKDLSSLQRLLSHSKSKKKSSTSLSDFLSQM